MRIAIVGSGGVGGLLGAMLLRGGSEVAFLARGAQLEAMRAGGLRVEGPVGSFAVPVPAASDDPAQLGRADAVLIAVKTWQMDGLSERLRPMLAGGGFVVSLQNGVEARDRLAEVLGEQRVAGGLCHLISWIEQPGLVRQVGPVPRVTVGEWEGGGSERLVRLAAELTRAGITAKIAPQIRAAVWDKALFVESFGAVGAVLRLPAGAWRAQPEPRAMLEEAMRETDEVARAAGAELGEPAIERALSFVDAVPAESTTSMHRDLLAGKPSELDEQTGAIVRAADRLKIPAPLHKYLYACLLPHERAARATATLHAWRSR